MNARLTAGIAAVLVAALVGTADLLIEPGDPALPESPVTPDTGDPVAGMWVCPVGGDDPDTELGLTVVRPDGSGDRADDGDRDDDLVASVEVAELDGTRSVVARGDLEPGSARSVEPESAPSIHWRGHPVVAHSEWLLGGSDLPAGIVARGCIDPVADGWAVPGLRTSGGYEARLTITNPFRSDASIRMRFLGPDGPEEPLALQNLSVSAYSSLEIVVNEYLPEYDDLAAIVDITSGRVAVEGVQLVRSAIGGIAGASVLSAAPRAAEQWTVPWFVDGDDDESWLWVLNPGDRTAVVELTVHTDDGGVVPDGLEEVVVDPLSMQRIPLSDTVPGDGTVAGITVRSDGAPVVASVASVLADEDTERTGYAVQLGSTEMSDQWTVIGGATEGRVEHLRIANPGSGDVRVGVALATETRVDRPSALQELVVPAGAMRGLDLTEHLDPEATRWIAFVHVEGGGVVTSRVGAHATESRRLVAQPAIPATAWLPFGDARPARFVAGMVQRLHTALGVRRDGPELTTPVPPFDTDSAPLDEALTGRSWPAIDDVPGDGPPPDDIDEEDADDAETDPDDPQDDADPSG